MSRVHFFATSKDIHEVAGAVDSKLALKAIRDFDEETPTPLTEYPSLSSIEGLGQATAGQSAHGIKYVLIERSVELSPGVRQTMSGANRHYMKATLDEKCASIQAGGEYHDAVIMGEVMYELSSKDSQRIVRAFRTAFKKHSAAHTKRGIWVGQEALEKLRAGCRLTHYYEHPNPELFDVSLAEIELNS